MSRGAILIAMQTTVLFWISASGLVFRSPYLKPANVCNTLAQYFKKSPHSHWLIKFNKIYQFLENQLLQRTPLFLIASN